MHFTPKYFCFSKIIIIIVIIEYNTSCKFAGKPLLMLQSVKRAFAIAPDNHELHECLVIFAQTGKRAVMRRVRESVECIVFNFSH